MKESDSNNPWDRSPEPEMAGAPGSVFEVVPPPVEESIEATAVPPMPMIPAPASVAADLEAKPDTQLVPPPIPTTELSSVAEPLLSGDYEARPDMPESPGGGGRLAWLGAIVGAFILLLGGGYFALTALNASGGAATPDEAVQKLIDAVNNEDFIGLGEMLEPGERRTLVTPVVQDILPELERLGVLSGDFDPAGVDGIDLEITNFTYRIEELPGNPDLVHVYATGGTTSFTTDVDAFPFGSEIRSRFGDRMENESEMDSVSGGGDPLTLVERNGRWYVSVWFSAAEVARIAADRDLPVISAQPQPLGSDSPEAAVESFVTAMSDFDLDGMLRRLDPEEAAALYRYSPLFLDDAQSSAEELRSELRDDIDWSVRDMGFEVDRDGDDAIVELTEFTFTVFGNDFDGSLEYSPQRIVGQMEGEIDGESGRGALEMTPTRWTIDVDADNDTLVAEVDIDPAARTVEFTATQNGEMYSGSIELDEAGLCSGYSLVGPDENRSGCLEDEGEEFLVDYYRGQLQQLFEIAESGFPGAPVAVHETDGRWYVSPTLSAMNWVSSGLQDIDEQEFRQFLDRLDEETGDSTLRAEELIGGPILGSMPGVATPFVASSLLFGVRVDPDDWLELGSEATPMFESVDSTLDEPVFEPIEVIPPTEDVTVSFVVEPSTEPTVYGDELGSAGDRHVYLVELESGQQLGITLYGSDRVGAAGIGDPLVTIEKPSGDYWLQNDDYDSLNSGIQFAAPEAGQWRIVVQDLNRQPGAYELTLERPDSGDEPTIGADPSTDIAEADIDDFSEIVVEPGSPVVISGDLVARTFDVYAFEVDAGTAFTITLEATPGESLDPRIIVRDGDLEVLIENDDADFDSGLAPLDSKVELTARSSDVLYVEARSVSDLGEGFYTLTITSS